MQQPKYQLGDILLIPLEVSNSSIGYKDEIPVEATVASISYDPEDKSFGPPLYIYGMQIHNCARIGIKEQDILGKVK